MTALFISCIFNKRFFPVRLHSRESVCMQRLCGFFRKESIMMGYE